MKLPSPQVRQYLYGIVTTALPLLAFLKVIDVVSIPLWLSVASAVLGTGAGVTAFAAVRQQRKDGTLQ